MKRPLLFLLFFNSSRTFCDCFAKVAKKQLKAFDRVVVTRNNVVDWSWISVSIYDTNNWNTECLCLFNSVCVRKNVNNDHRTWLTVKVFNATILNVKFVNFLLETLNFELIVALFKITRSHAALKIFQLFDLCRYGVNIGKHTTDPTLSNEWLTCLFSSCPYDILSLLFCTNKQNLLAATSDFSKEWKRLIKAFYRFSQVNDVTVLTLRVNILGHFWVPAARFVSKVNTSFEQSFNIDSYCHLKLLVPHPRP